MAMSTRDYPAIRFTDDDRIREESLKRIGRAFQAEMDAQANPCALKGGTALRFTLGLPRPSTDLDFEGDNRIQVKKSLKRALRNGLRGEKYTVGLDWGKLGTIKLRRAGWSRRGRPRLKIDYRLTGTFPGMPARTPLDKTELRDGIRSYKANELVKRKLQTIIGDSPRVLPRDVYDTGWIATVHPDLITKGGRTETEGLAATNDRNRKGRRHQVRPKRGPGNPASRRGQSLATGQSRNITARERTAT